MDLVSRPYLGDAAEDALITALLRGQPGLARHLTDLPWRLSCPDTQSGRFARLWQAPAGSLAAFAAWQTPWAALDLFACQDRDSPALRAAVLAWAHELFAGLDNERGRPLPYWLEYREDDAATRAFAISAGYRLTEDRYLRLELTLPGPARQRLPPAVTVRPLAGEAECEDYAGLHRAAFASTSMTAGWRRRTLRMPHYLPELDLVAVTPDGTLAGFCLGWLDAGRRTVQIEPLGVRPGCTGRGIALALLLEMTRRFAAAGADLACVEVEPGNERAIRSYRAAGFRRAHLVRAAGRLMSAARS